MSAAPCEFHEGKVCPHHFRPLASFCRAQLSITPVAIEDPGLTLVTQTDVEDFPQPLFGTGCGHRRDNLHTPGEIAEHPVGRTNVKFAIERICVASGEMEDPRVLEKASNDGTHANALTAAGNTRPEAAEPPDHQINRYACTSRCTQRLNDRGILELVHLGYDAGWAPSPLVVCLPLDQL